MKYKQNKLICLCYLWIEHQANAGTVVQATTGLWLSALSTAIGLYDGGRAPEYLSTGPPRQRWGPWIQQHRALQGPAKHQHGAPAPAPGVFFSEWTTDGEVTGAGELSHMGYQALMCNGNTEHADEGYTHGSPLPVEKRACRLPRTHTAECDPTLKCTQMPAYCK